MDIAERLALSALLGPVGEALAESAENLKLESAGNIQRLLGFTPQVAEVIHKWFGGLDFPAAKLLASLGEFEDGPVGIQSPKDFRNPDMVDEDDVHMMVGFGFYGVWSKVRFPSEDPYHGAPDDLADFLKRNPKIVPKINSTPIGPACLEVVKQAILSKKNPGRVMIPLGGGWNWMDLGTSCDDAEAADMQHCGTDNRGTLISLRDPQGNSHVTMTYDGNTVHQIKGKQNTVPVRKYWPYIEQFFKQTGAELNDWWLESAAKEKPGGDDFDDAPDLLRLLNSYRKHKTPIGESAVRNNSIAMVMVPGDPPGRNVCAFVRSLVQGRSRVIVVAQSGRLAPGNFERMMRASMPDCEKKLRIMDASGPSLADALNSAQRNHHYSPSQALEVYCDQQAARGFQQEVSDGSLKFDPTVIHIVPSRIPSDAGDDIVKAVSREDNSAMHRVLDPHIFSSQEGLADYKQALIHTEGVIREATRWQNFLANTKLRTIPWQLDNYVEGVEQWDKELPDDMGVRGPLYCSVVLVSAAEFSKRTRRGNPNAPGWMVDCEIFMVEPDDPGNPMWFFHSEKRFSDLDQARAHVEKVKSFVDGKTLLELERYPKSGKIAMSKVERRSIMSMVDEVLREFLTDIADNEEDGVDLLNTIVMRNAGLLSSRGISVGGMQFLGAGSNGAAWKLRNGRVLKVTTDDAEAHVAAHIKGKRFKHVFTIYDVWAFPGQYNGHHVYGLVTEENLQKPSQVEQDEFDEMVEVLEHVSDEADVNIEDDLRKVLQTLMAGKWSPSLKRKTLESVKKFDLPGMMADMKRLGVLADLHAGNFMRRSDGTFVIIDIGTGGDQESAKPPFLEDQNFFDIEVPSLDDGRLNEFGTGAPGSGANGPVQARASNSSSWASGQLALKDPRNHVPEDENEQEQDRALDWGPGRVSGASF